MAGYALPPTHFSIDVECVATGTDHNARAVAQISLVVGAAPPRRRRSRPQPALARSRRLRRLPPPSPRPQDQYERVLLNLYVRPEQPVVSYLTPLTGCAARRVLRRPPAPSRPLKLPPDKLTHQTDPSISPTRSRPHPLSSRTAAGSPRR